MPAQATEIRAKLRAIIEAEFAVEISNQNWTVHDDKLHRSLGGDGQSRFGLSPNTDQPWGRDQQVQITEVLVQFYGAYELEVNPEQHVDPAGVEAVAERLKRALKQATDPADPRAWFFNALTTTYLDDPTGNKTRFELVVQGYGNNAALVETTG